jgi:hypothetical protein
MAAHPSKSPSQMMFVLTYTPRADADAHGYEDWLRAVDNPFFNAQPGIVRYENWKVHANKNGVASFTYLDLMYIEDEAAIEKIWTNPALLDFAQKWTEKWGRVPQAVDQQVNYHVVLCEELAGQRYDVRSEWAIFLPYVRQDGAADRGYDTYLREVDNPFFNSDEVPELTCSSNWLRTRDIVGTEWWTDFDLMFVNGPDGLEQLLGNPKSAGFAANWATTWGNRPADGIPANFEAQILELVASPDKK